MRRNMSIGASGLQIAILIFAIVFLAYPTQKYLGPLLGITDAGSVVRRLFIFVPLILLLALVPSFRRFSLAQLRTPIEPGRRAESFVLASSQAIFPFAIAGAIVLWHWGLGGEMALARRIGQQRSPEDELTYGLSLEGVLLYFVLGGVVAPVVEELLFRGLLYRAWEARWGWFLSMLATSLVFALYHPTPFAAFISSIVFVCALRRTGSIWGPIIVHAAGNILLSPLLLGRHFFRTAGKETGEIALWWMHIAAFAILMIGILVYVWMSRDPKAVDSADLSTEIRCA